MKLRLCAVLGTLLAAYAGAAAAGDGYSGEELSADIVAAVVPLTSYAIAHYKDDGTGEGQFLRSNAVSLVLNSAIRVGVNQTRWGVRPNGGPYAFPSGHVAFITSSAAFLQDRYGWKYGVPAYVLTGYVAWVRVDTDHHRWRDVAAAAALSTGVSRLFVTPVGAIHLAPVIGPDWLGLRWERSF